MAFSRNPIQIEIIFDGADERPEEIYLENDQVLKVPIFNSDDAEIAGQVRIIPNIKPFKFKEITIELRSHIKDGKSALVYNFQRKTLALKGEGVLNETESFPFSFTGIEAPPDPDAYKIGFERPYESCKGYLGSLNYFLRVTVKHKSFGDLILDKDIVIHLDKVPGPIRLYQTRINFKDQHVLSFKMSKRIYNIDDIVFGLIDFVPNRPRPKKLRVFFRRNELLNLRPESTSIPQSRYDTLEDIDLSAEAINTDKNEGIPIKIDLSKYNLQPSFYFKKENVKFGISYALRIYACEDDLDHQGIWHFDVRLPLIRPK